MTFQEKIQKKAEGFGKLAPVFLEGANFALENQWISVKDDLPCNHEELSHSVFANITSDVVALRRGDIYLSRMRKLNGKWQWETYEPTHWIPIPELPKE